MPQIKNSPAPYCGLDYYSPQRLGQYYYQIKAVRESGVKTVLEVGPGPGAVTHILRTAGIEVTTCDCEKKLKPDICGDIRQLPLADKSFEFTLCCQVLEHLQFDDFVKALRELDRVTQKHILISIPYVSKVIYSLHKLPGGRRSSWVLHFPWLPVRREMMPGHCWEMGRKGFARKKIVQAIQSVSLEIIEDFTPADSPNNQYFLLRSQNG